MQITICHICGWDLKEYYSGGDICPCCGNEYDFADCLFKEEILEKMKQLSDKCVNEYARDYVSNIESE